MRKVIVILLVFLSLVAISIRYGTKPLAKALGLQSRAGLRVESTEKTKVFLDDLEVGETPYQDETLASKEYLIKLEKVEATEEGKIAWQGYAKLNPGTLTVVNRELNDQKSAQSGEVITLEKGKGVTVISTPMEAEVMVDGEVKGRTPFSLSDLSPGEHQFILSRDNFLKRSIRATLLEGFNLVLAVDLAISEVDLTKLPVTPVTQTQQVIVKNTPTGFLNVRETASVNGKIVTTVKPGETLTLLEEIANWNRIRTEGGEQSSSSNKEGWVSSIYTQKKN